MIELILLASFTSTLMGVVSLLEISTDSKLRIGIHCLSRLAVPKRRVKKKPVASKAARKVSENELHMKCWQWVAKAHPELLIFHVANELKAHVSYHLKQKRLGKLNGVADFLAFTAGCKVAIELKDDKGEHDDDQIRFQKRWERVGGAYYVVRTLDEFQRIVSALAVFG